MKGSHEKAKERLLDWRSRLDHDVRDLAQETQRAEESDVPSDDSEVTARSVHQDRMLLQNEQHIREEIEAALGRIEKGTYGVCEGCGETIPAGRLEALPFARKCIKCAS